MKIAPQHILGQADVIRQRLGQGLGVGRVRARSKGPFCFYVIYPPVWAILSAIVSVYFIKSVGTDYNTISVMKIFSSLLCYK